ncbi:cytochrome c [Chryseobacterium sp.]|uniref:c-type cytochrome n=1 Tax=Chryseobacterium sp. TaxID=1871047 RepID=UPI0025C17AAF|nr:cytochrome c [Chryseobacterium sp.]
MKKLIVSSFFISIVLASCTPKTSAVTGPVNTSAEKLAQGKTIFDNSCGRCHDLPEPTAHTPVQWVGIMNAMAPKAKLNDEQHQLVYDYIVSVKK